MNNRYTFENYCTMNGMSHVVDDKKELASIHAEIARLNRLDTQFNEEFASIMNTIQEYDDRVEEATNRFWEMRDESERCCNYTYSDRNGLTVWLDSLDLTGDLWYLMDEYETKWIGVFPDETRYSKKE